MCKMKNIMKRSMLLLLSLALVMSSMDMSAFAAEKEIVKVTSEIIDLGEFSLENSGSLSFFNEENGIIDLKEGNYEKWIDRIDIPEYGIEFYNTLVEYSDNDGEDDLLILEEGFSKENAISINYGSGIDTFNAIKIVTLKNPTKNEINFVYKLIRAVYDAFLMDHPEVFWLSGKTSSYQVKYSYSDGTSKCDFYTLLKMHDGSLSDSFNEFLAEDYQTEAAITADIEARDYAVDLILNTPAVQNANSDYELVKAFNEWLTKNNEYNTLVSSGDPYGNFKAHNCLSALLGSDGTAGPVCEGYAEAFKILCDRKEIPCVLVSGPATSSPESEGESHAWNFTKINDAWYGVDVTWNDPTVSGISGKTSGYENENYLLVGSETMHGELEFQESHKIKNTVSTGNQVAFINGPILSKTAYLNSEIPDEPEIYIISWDVDGDGKVDETTEYTYGETPSHANGVKPADAQYTYTFTGWSPTITSVTGDKTYTAQFSRTAKKYTIKWDIDGNGTTDDTTTYTYGETPSHANGVKPADAQYTYTFTGWNPAITSVTGDKTYTAQFEKLKKEDEPDKVKVAAVFRIAGEKRTETSRKVAETLKELRNFKKFDAVVVATSLNDKFADALSGSYLAVRKNAPMILTNGKPDDVEILHNFIKENITPGGMVYILGGDQVVPKSVETIQNAGYQVKRLAKTERYGTNLEILNEAGIEKGTDIIVATGKKFGDSLSASALKKPILLVKPTATNLTAEQIEMIKKAEGGNIYIVGGTSSVTIELENELKSICGDRIIRIAGTTTIETSKEIANYFFGEDKDVQNLVIASSKIPYDGLCGGPLAAALDAPLLLTRDSRTTLAEEYVKAKTPGTGYALGGTSALSNQTVVDIFELDDAGQIN